MRVVTAFAVLLLAASAQGQFFRITKNGGPSTVYRVRGLVTLTTPELSGRLGSAFQYYGDLAVRRLTHDNYAALFLNFKVEKYNRTLNSADDPVLVPSDGTPPVVEDYSEYFKDPINFVYKHGKILTHLVPFDAKMWTANIYRAVLTVFQSPPVRPKEIVDAPRVFSVYEDGISGYCRVQYELKVLNNKELNFTKTHYLDDCQVDRPTYLLDEVDVHGCPGVCSKHVPTNFIPGQEEEKTDYLSKPKPGCPVSMRPIDTQVNFHSTGKYIVHKHQLHNASGETLDIFRQYSGKITSRTKFEIGLLHHNGPEIDKAKHTTFYDTLAFTPPEVYNDLDVPVYSFYLNNITELKPEVFNLYFKTAVEELIHLDRKDDTSDPKKAPFLALQMIEALSAMTKEQILKTIPPPVTKKLSACNQNEQLERSLYLDLLSKAGSNSSVNVLLDLLTDKVLTNFESVSILQDIAAFKAYPDVHYVDNLLDLCLLKKNKTELSPLVLTTACATVGTVIAKACPSIVDFPPYVPEPPKDVDGPFVRPNATDPEFPPPEEGGVAESPPFEYKERENCTVTHLVKYVEKLTTALNKAKDFKHAVALVTALAKAAKPEIIPSILPYVNGTAPNLPHLVDEGETVEEAVVFFRQITLLVLNDLVTFFPKEINPIVRTIYLNISEPHQLRVLAFDIWLKSVPAQWEVQKVLITAKLDESVELGSYVYTALKTLLHNKLPCNEILASRVRAVFRHVEHLDLGCRLSHLYKPSTYNYRREFGVEATFKKIASNTSRLAASHLSLLYNVAPYYRIPASYSLLPKGGEHLIAEVIGKGGLLELISKVLDPNHKPEPQPPRTVDIAKQLNITDRVVETPKAALLWKFLNGETVLPVDKQYIQILKQEIVEWVRQLVSGGGKKHFLRVLLPAKQYHVEPTTLGIPLVHSVVHPIIVSLRVDNLVIKYRNRPNTLMPLKLYVTGTFHPAVLSLRKTLVFAAGVQKLLSPSVTVSDVKEVALKATTTLSYYHPTKRVYADVKPEFNRVLLTTHCVEHALKNQLLLSADPSQPWLDYGVCVKSLPVPYIFNHDLTGQKLGMVLKLNGTSHKPWSGLSVFGSPQEKKEGYIQALFQSFANLGWKHHAYTIGLESYVKDPVDTWRFHYRVKNNMNELVPGTNDTECPWCTPPPPPPAEVLPSMWSILRMRGAPKENEIPDDFIEEESETAAAQYYPELTDLPEMHDKVELLLNETQKPLYKTTYKYNVSIVLVGCYRVHLKRIIKTAINQRHTLDHTARKIGVLVKNDVFTHDLEAYGNVTYPEMDSFFNLDPAFIGTDFVNASLVTDFISKLTQEREKYILYYNATKAAEQLVGFHNYHYKPLIKWYTPQCLADLKAGKTVSYACYEAVVHDGHLNQQTLTVTLPKKVDSGIKQASMTAIDLLKYYLFPRVVFHPADPVLSSNDQLVFYFNKTMANPFITLLNAQAYLPHEKLVVKNLPVPKYFSPNTALETGERIARTITKNCPLMPCGVGKYSVRTFDNLTYPLEVRPACSYLLTRDCSGVSNLTVVMVPLDVTTGLKKLIVQLSNTIVELLPPARHIPQVQLSVNGTQYLAQKDKDVVLPFDEKDIFMVNVHRVPNPRGIPLVVLKTTNHLLKIHYDGYNAYVWLNKKFQRSACGLCGNYDNEASHELVTPENVEATNYTMFTTSYAFGGLIGSTCKVPVPPINRPELELELYRSMISGDISGALNTPSVSIPKSLDLGFEINAELFGRTETEDTVSEEVVSEEVNECVVKRTIIRHREDLVCFSKVLVPTCKTDCVKTKGTKVVDVSFTCLPKSDPKVSLWTRKVREEGSIPISYHDESYPKIVQKIRIPEDCAPAQ